MHSQNLGRQPVRPVGDKLDWLNASRGTHGLPAQVSTAGKRRKLRGRQPVAPSTSQHPTEDLFMRTLIKRLDLDPKTAWVPYQPSDANPFDLKKAGHLFRRAASAPA